MTAYVVTCAFNTSQKLFDCVFKNESSDAKKYVAELDGDKFKAVAHFWEIFTLREGEEMVMFLAEEDIITF